MITDSDCVYRFGENYSLSRYKPLPWTGKNPPDANWVQLAAKKDDGSPVTFVGSVQTDCRYTDQSHYLVQRKVGQEQKNKFEIFLRDPNETICKDTNAAVCRFCPLDCNGGVCKFDVNDEAFCDCSTAVDVANDCYQYTSDPDVAGFRPFNLPRTGVMCEDPPAGLPAGFVTDLKVGDHGQCFSTHKDYTNGQNGGCAPGLFHVGCANTGWGDAKTGHVCAVNSTIADCGSW